MAAPQPRSIPHWRRLLVAVLLTCCCAVLHLSAQTGTSTTTLSGLVQDQQGRPMQGARVVVRNEATGAALSTLTTNSTGAFAVGAIGAGVYRLTIAADGFKTVVLTAVTVVTSVPANVGVVTLPVGPVTEQVDVDPPTEIIHTQTTGVTSTIRADQIRGLPLITKNVLNFVTLLPGVDTGGTHVARSSTISGLPQSAIGITLDGTNSQDDYGKSSDGFFSMILPSTDAVEEVTLSAAAPAADSSGQGAVQIHFVTRSGTNVYRGSAYEYFRHPRLNANSFFNIANGVAKNDIKLHQYGGNVGGPFQLPGRGASTRAFFFFNYEELWQPIEVTRSRVIVGDAARLGNFTYLSGGATRTVNVLTVAAQKGQIAAIDPTIGRVLGDIAAAAQTTGTVTPNADPNTSTLAYNVPSAQTRHFPTVRVDVNLTPSHRLSTTYYFQKYNSDPDVADAVEPRFPGFPNQGSQYSYRHQGTAALRSALSPSLVNEAAFGLIWSPISFWANQTAANFENQGGYSLGFRPSPAVGFSAFNSLDIATAGSPGSSPAAANGNNPSSSNGWDWNAGDNVYWQRGRHSLQFGGMFTQVRAWSRDQQLAPGVTFGVDTSDPASAMFTTANFPGASATNLNDAKQLYALLTGRVTSIQGKLALDGATGRYVYDGPGVRRLHMNEIGVYAQDSWRARPELTVNYGVRYELQFPIQPDDSPYSIVTVADACGRSGVGAGFGTGCNLFSPGTLTGTPTAGFQPYTSGAAYRMDLNNVAPSAGVAWQPRAESRAWRAVLGDADSATLRAGFARSYIRDGLGALSSRLEANPGIFIQQIRNSVNGNLVLPGESSPLLLSQTSRMGPGAFDVSPAYPLPVTRSTALNLFDPDFHVGAVDSFSVGLERSVSKDTAVEIRYVGTRGHDLRETENWNEVNLAENGFLDEFKRAQANLYANVAAGRGQTIAYFGPSSGTSPLPVYLAFFNGVGAAGAGDPSRYTGSSWTNGTIVGRFAKLNPSPSTSASTDLLGSATFRGNAAAAGLPLNYFQLNPDVGLINVDVSRGSTRYDALQIDVRRRLSHGLAFDANYTYAQRWTSRLDSLHTGRYLVPSTSAVPHAFKATANYELPIGRDRAIGSDMNRWLDAAAGGWSVNLAARVQSGQVLDFGNVRVVGMSQQELQDAVAYRVTAAADGTTRVYDLPQDIIDNTVKAFSTNVNGYTAGEPAGRYLAPANGPDCIQANRGDCAPKDVFVVAPIFTRCDLSVRKTVPTGGRTSLSVEIDVFNLFNAIGFNPVVSTSTNPDAYRVTSSYSDITNSLDPGSRSGQIVIRFKF